MPSSLVAGSVRLRQSRHESDLGPGASQRRRAQILTPHASFMHGDYAICMVNRPYFPLCVRDEIKKLVLVVTFFSKRADSIEILRST